MIYTPEELWEHYEALSQDSKTLLQMLMLHGLPVKAEELKLFFRYHMNRRKKGDISAEPLLDDLRAKELLYSEGGGFLYGATEIQEDVCVDAVFSEEMPQILEFTELWAKKNSADPFLEFRRRLYAGDPTLLETLSVQQYHSYARRLAFGISRSETLKIFPINHAVGIALEKLELGFSNTHGSDIFCSPFLDFLEGLSEVKLADFVVEEVQLHRVLRQENVTDPTERVRAIQDLFAGKPVAEPELLVNDFGRSVLWEFFPLAAGWRPTSELETLGGSILHSVLASGDSPLLEQELRRLDYVPFDHAFVVLVSLFWAGRIESAPPGALSMVADRLSLAEFYRLADELEALVRHTKDESYPLTPFLALHKPRPRWEQALLRLAHIKKDSFLVESPPERLVWVVNPILVRDPLICRVQKIGARGDWTSGKKIKLDQLAEYTHCMDEHDRKVWRAYQEAHVTTGWYSHAPEPRSLYPVLVGHPRLYMHKQEHRRVEFVKGVPTLRTRCTEEGIELSVFPQMDRYNDVVAQETAEGCFEIFSIDESARLAAVFGEQGSISVPFQEMERVRTVLDSLVNEGFRWEGEGPLVGEQLTEHTGDPTPVIRLWPLKKGLEGCVWVRPVPTSGRTFKPGSGPQSYSERIDGSDVVVHRDLSAERKLYREIKALLKKDARLKGSIFRLALPDLSLDFLARLKDLPEDSYRLEWPQGVAYRIRSPLTLDSLSMNLRSESSWFSIEGSVKLTDDQRIELLKLMEDARSFPDFVPMDDGSYLQLSQSLRLTLRALEAANISKSDERIEVHKMTCALLTGLAGVEADDAGTSYLERVREVLQTEFELPQGLEANLRPYQLEGYLWLRRAAELQWGVCLADDMGLGKTVQTLALLCARSEKPTLVVAPTSVASNWQSEAKKFVPSLNTYLLSEAEDRVGLLESLASGDVLITSYGLLVNESEKLAEISWGAVVLDEAQAIKNHRTKRAKAARDLKADFRLAATGTPVENHPEELWSLFQFLNPGLLGSKQRFDQRIGGSDGREALAKLVRPFILRRLKSQVLHDLPPRVDSVLWVDLTEEEKLFYEARRLQAVTRLSGKHEDLISVLAELTKLRRACCHPKLVDKKSKLKSSKLRVLKQMLASIREAGHAALVFSQFVDHLTIAKEMLEAEGISYLYLDGSTPAKQRKSLVDSFQAGEGEVFLISLKAGGTGLNLTRATYVFHLDPWWNPAVEDQASDRAHRIGQKESVSVYRLIAKDTIEQKILRMHDEKRDLAGQILQGTDQTGKLDSAALMQLMEEAVALV